MKNLRGILGRIFGLVIAAIAFDPPVAIASPATDDRPIETASRQEYFGVTIEPPQRVRIPGFEWDHEVRVALPPGYHTSNAAYPVLWVTDGSWLFNTVVEQVNIYQASFVPKMIVVSIGVPRSEEAHFQARRIFDFFGSSPAAENLGVADEITRSRFEALYQHLESSGEPVRFGGAPAFSDYLAGDLRRQLSKSYRMNGDHSLFGYSAGGAFCASVFLTHPARFQRYICGGMSVRSNLDLEQVYAKNNSDLPARIFFGFAEQDILDGWTFHLGQRLASRNYPSLKLQTRIFPDENHTSVIPPLIGQGLRSLWSDEEPDRQR